jgi:proton-translocating NADH-quinone oxidoreductase chain L
MFKLDPILMMIPVLPLVGAGLITLLGPRLLRGQSHWPCILGAAGACVLSFIVLFTVGQTADDKLPAHTFYYTWFQAGDVDVGFSLRADGLTAVMLVTVTFVGTLIAIFSVGYMRDDPGYPRFFAEISLFLFSMTGLVLADNFILLYAFWEGVGLCSYLLIGFWYTKPAAAAAARKAFLVTRLGDIGLFIGILLIWFGFSTADNFSLASLDFGTVFAHAALQDPVVITGACLLLFCGAVGKSAQFPLHVWLPDAMEGPTPVSALIHAATMVTAGVYLVARCMPLFALSPEAQLVVAVIGGLTALLAALMAVTQTDLKRILAYSTVSQLGFMFLALGSGVSSQRLAGLAVTAAIFHLFTHAFFKALLFLGSGSVMHAMGGVIDLRRFSGLRRVLPITHWTFLCGAAALAGVPLLSGFWSKDEILAVTMEASQSSVGLPIAPAFFRATYLVLFVLALVTAGLTAFYTFRAYFRTFWGEENIPPEAGHHAHESPPVMTGPLIVLAVGALSVGLAFGPTGLFAHYLEDKWTRNALPTLVPQAHHFNLVVMLASSAVALGGVTLAWWFYIRRPQVPAELVRAMPGAYELSRNRFYLDELYVAFLVRPLSGLAYVARVFDQYIVDGLVDLFARVPQLLGYLVRPIQNGLVQFYALVMVLGLAGFLLSVLLR